MSKLVFPKPTTWFLLKASERMNSLSPKPPTSSCPFQFLTPNNFSLLKNLVELWRYFLVYSFLLHKSTILGVTTSCSMNRKKPSCLSQTPTVCTRDGTGRLPPRRAQNLPLGAAETGSLVMSRLLGRPSCPCSALEDLSVP